MSSSLVIASVKSEVEGAGGRILLGVILYKYKNIQHNFIAGAMQIKQLARNTAYFRRRLKQMGFIVHGHEMAPIMSLMIYDPLKLITFSREMLRHKVAVVAAGFPATQLILARIRFCISATHSKEILDQVIYWKSDYSRLGNHFRHCKRSTLSVINWEQNLSRKTLNTMKWFITDKMIIKKSP